MTLAALWGPGSGAPITATLAAVVVVGAVAVALVVRYRPDLIARAERWLEEHL